MSFAQFVERRLFQPAESNPKRGHIIFEFTTAHHHNKIQKICDIFDSDPTPDKKTDLNYFGVKRIKINGALRYLLLTPLTKELQRKFWQSRKSWKTYVKNITYNNGNVAKSKVSSA